MANDKPVNKNIDNLFMQKLASKFTVDSVESTYVRNVKISYKEKISQLKKCYSYADNILYNRYLSIIKSKDMTAYFRKLMNVVDFI